VPGLLFSIIAPIGYYVVWLWAMFEGPEGIPRWVWTFGLSVVSVGPSLLVHHFAVRRVAMLGGVVRCGWCGAKGESLRAGTCRACESRSASRPGLPTKARRTDPALPVRWRPLWLCAGVGTLVLLGAQAALQKLHVHQPYYYACVIAKSLGIAQPNPNAPYGFGIDGVGFQGDPPEWLNLLVVLVVRGGPIALFGIALAAAYHRLALARPTGRPGLVCGWCGYNLAGITAERCPECGRGFEDRGRRGDRPPARRLWPKLRTALLAGIVALVTLSATFTLIGLTVRLTHLEHEAERFAYPLLGLLVDLPTCVAGLAAYHIAVRRFVMLDGKVRCGKCGGVVGSLAAGPCGKCGAELGGAGAPGR